MENFIILIISLIIILLWMKKGRTLNKDNKVIVFKFDVLTRIVVLLFLIALLIILGIAIYDSFKYGDSNSISATILFCFLLSIVLFYYIYISKKLIGYIKYMKETRYMGVPEIIDEIGNVYNEGNQSDLKSMATLFELIDKLAWVCDKINTDNDDDDERTSKD